MRKRKDIENNASRFTNHNVLILEVLLDMRDILVKATKVKRKKKEGV